MSRKWDPREDDGLEVIENILRYRCECEHGARKKDPVRFRGRVFFTPG
jgi:hypothetical protein